MGRQRAFLSKGPIRQKVIIADAGLLEGAFHSFQKAYEIFSEQRDFYGFLMDFSCKLRDFCQRRTRFFGVKCPSGLLSTICLCSTKRTIIII